MYYPAKKFAGFPFVCPYPGRFPCAEEYVSTDLNDYEELGRTFGVGTPGLPVTSTEPQNPSPSSSDSNTGTSANEPAFAPIPTSPIETESPTSKAGLMQVYYLSVIALSSAVLVITFV